MKYRVALMLLTCLALAGLASLMASTIRQNFTQLHFNVNPQADKVTAESCRLEIEPDGPLDRIKLVVRFKAEEDDVGTVLIDAPAWLSASRSRPDPAISGVSTLDEFFAPENSVTQSAAFTIRTSRSPDRSALLTQEFSGVALRRGGVTNQLDLLLLGIDGPVEVAVGGLDQLDLATPFPPPTQQYRSWSVWRFGKPADAWISPRVSFHIRDLSADLRRERNILWGGILLGVLSSILASFFFGAASHLDKRSRRLQSYAQRPAEGVAQHAHAADAPKARAADA